MSIDWRKLQTNLGVTPDGIAGRNTFAAYFRRVAVAAGVSPDQSILNSIATAAVIHFPEYGITDSVDRLVDWSAQTANETGGFKVFEENLRYSASGLVKTWPKHFTVANAPAFVGHPDLIANKAYGERMGNVLPADGYNFRGRGMLQLTGRSNYEASNKRLGIGLDTNPEMAAVPALSLIIACDFYRVNDVLGAIDKGNFTLARKITNGGDIGLGNVNAIRAKLMPLFA